VIRGRVCRQLAAAAFALLALVCGPASAQVPRLFWAEVELEGPLTEVVLEPARGGSAIFELDLRAGERVDLALPLPLGDPADLDFAPPVVRGSGGGAARFVRYEPAPRLAGVPRVLVALARPSGDDQRPATSLPALCVAFAASFALLALAPRAAAPRRAVLVFAASALVGTLATLALALRPAPPLGETVAIDRLAAPPGASEPPRLVQRRLATPFEPSEDSRPVVETSPAGVDLAVRGRLAGGRLAVSVEAVGGALVVLEAALPASGTDDPLAIPATAVRRWRDSTGSWWRVPAGGGELVPGAAPTLAFASVGLPQGRTALVAEDGARVWRVVDLVRDQAAAP